MKKPRKRNKWKGVAITCCYIWHVNTSKCAYKIFTYSVKVWWRYVHFCDIFSDIGQCIRLAQTKGLKNQKSASL